MASPRGRSRRALRPALCIASALFGVLGLACGDLERKYPDAAAAWALSKGEYERALGLFEQVPVPAREPSWYVGVSQATSALEKIGAREAGSPSARQILEDGLSRFPTSSTLWIAKVYHFIQRGEHDAALAAMNEAERVARANLARSGPSEEIEREEEALRQVEQLRAYLGGRTPALGSKASERAHSTAPAFELREIAEATTAFRSMLEDPDALRPRETLIEVYRREGFRSAAAFYEATVEVLRRRSVSEVEPDWRETWRCPVVEDTSLLTDARRELLYGDTKSASELARKHYEANRHACQGATLWAWAETHRSDVGPEPESLELAIRTLLTSAADGVPFPDPRMVSTYDIYESLALNFLAAEDRISAAVAARRAEVRVVSAGRELSAGDLRILQGLQRNAFVRFPQE